MGHAQAKHAPAIVNVLAVSFLEFMQCHLRGSGGPATCKTVARRDCAPHTVMRAGRPRTRHARGSIMLHFAIGGCPLRLARPSPLASRFSLLASRLSPLASSPLASRLARLSPLASSPRASSPLASSPLASRLIPSRLTPHASRLIPSRLTPHASFPRGSPARAHTRVRPSTRSSHIQRATFNLQLLAPRASPLIPSRLSPLADRKSGV